jgi:hypothetical protein
MRHQNASLDLALAVADLAARSHGVVAHRQLLALGMTASMVQRWLDSGRLHRLHRGVYAVGHAALTGEGRWLAGVLACGPQAVLSHQPAAALLSLRRSSSPVIHVTTPRRANPPGITVHRVRRLDPEDVTEHEQIPVTSVARTSLDLAGILTLRQLIRVLEQAERLRLFDLNAIERLLDRSQGRRGAKLLRRAITEMTGEPPHVNSDWERDLLDFCDDHGIPRPELNVLVEGYLVDALWRAQKLIVELDSWHFHRSRSAFVEDRAKLCALQLAGYRVLPLTKLDEGVARMLNAATAAR